MIAILIIYGRKSTEKFTTSTSADNQYIHFYANLKNGYLTIGPEGVEKNIVLIKKIDTPFVSTSGDIKIGKTMNEPLLFENIVSEGKLKFDLTNHEGDENNVKVLENKVQSEFSIKLDEKMQGYYIVIVYLPRKSKITIKTSEDTTFTKPVVSTLSKDEITGVKDVKFDANLTEIVYNLYRQQKFKTSQMYDDESASTKQTTVNVKPNSTNVETATTKEATHESTHSDDFIHKSLSEIHKHLHENM